MSSTPDVRPIVAGYAGTHIPTVFAENQRRMKQAQRVDSQPKGGFGSFFRGSAQPAPVDLQEQQAMQHKQFAEIMQQRQATPPPAPAAQQQQQQAPQAEGFFGGLFGKKKD